MKKAQIEKLFTVFEANKQVIEQVAFWSARDLQKLLEYKDWRTFSKLIKRATIACKESGNDISNHFVFQHKMVTLGSGAQRKVEDIVLSRYAAYLLVLNGDPAKEKVAFAQTYFAVQTRKQEIIEQRLLDLARLKAREKLTKSEKALSKIAYERGVDSKGFAIIRSRGDKVLFGGNSTADMKHKYGIPKGRPLADFLPTLMIRAKSFITELTAHNTDEKDLKGTNQIATEHEDNSAAVRKMLNDRGVKPENLPAGEDAKKLKRRIEKEDKNSLK